MHLIHAVNPPSFCKQMRVQRRSSHISQPPCTSANRHAPPHQEAAVCTVDQTFHMSSPEIKKEHTAVYPTVIIFAFSSCTFLFCCKLPHSHGLEELQTSHKIKPLLLCLFHFAAFNCFQRKCIWKSFSSTNISLYKDCLWNN